MSPVIEAARHRLINSTVVLLFGAFIVLGIGIGLTLSATGVLATHDDPNTIHACVYTSSGYTQIMPPGVTPNCRSNQFLVEWQSSSSTADLEARIEALETTVASQETQISNLETDLSALAAQVPDCLSQVDDDAVFSGCNVQINNGEGSTATKDGTETEDGTGNLIIGYNENTLEYDRTGSHNLVVGMDHGYSSWGGIVAGHQNQIIGEYSSVTSGFFNVASGTGSSVSGGSQNKSLANFSSISGGNLNEASGVGSSITGGQVNKAKGGLSTVNGGSSNEAIGLRSSVNGGGGNKASGPWSSVSGGELNEAGGHVSSVSGGQNNTAVADYSAVGGGQDLTTISNHEFLPN